MEGRNPGRKATRTRPVLSLHPLGFSKYFVDRAYGLANSSKEGKVFELLQEVVYTNTHPFY